MNGIANRFFLVAVVSVILGMLWGIQMSASGDHTLSPAHAHLNLIGWVTMGLYGVYYAITPRAAEGNLPQLQFWLALAGVILIAPGIAMAINGTTELLAVIGSFLTLGAAVIFLVVVWRNGIGA